MGAVLCSSYYETPKYIRVADARLASLRLVLGIAIALYVGVVEVYMQGGYLSSHALVGSIRFSLFQPTVNACDPFENNACQNNFVSPHDLAYCSQSFENYPGPKLSCQIYEAINAQMVKESSIVVLTKASQLEQALVSKEEQQAKNRTYQTVHRTDFYTSQPEAFTLLLDHAVVASQVAAPQSATTHAGRLLVPSNHELCLHAYPHAYSGLIGNHTTIQAPCYIPLNRTESSNHDFVSLQVLLAAAGIDLEDCVVVVDDNSNGTCLKTRRASGGTLLLHVEWKDFVDARHLDSLVYEYKVQWMADAYKESIPYYSSYRDQRTLLQGHGIQVKVWVGGSHHVWDATTLLITLTTAVGLFAVATILVDSCMLYILPEKETYQQAKYEGVRPIQQHSNHGHHDEDEHIPSLEEPLLLASAEQPAPSLDSSSSL